VAASKVAWGFIKSPVLVFWRERAHDAAAKACIGTMGERG